MGLSAFYKPQQVAELKVALGITLDSTEGLLSEGGIRESFGLSQIAKYRKRGTITPFGYAVTGGGLIPFYQPQQIAKLKTALGITLDSTEGLLNETEFLRVSGLFNIAAYRKRRLIKPIGFAMAGPRVGAFYHPRQIAELKKALGITLESTDGLLNEKEFGKVSGFSRVSTYRKRGLIKPIGHGMSKSGVSAFYDRSQIGELKKALGITLDNTDGLLNESEFIRISGLTNFATFRNRGLIKPVGFALRNSGLVGFYHPHQIAELKQRLAELRSR